MADTQARAPNAALATEADDGAQGVGESLGMSNNRRNFLRAAGLGGMALALPGVFAACANEAVAPTAAAGGAALGVGDGVDAAATVVLDFSNDFGVLNYAYALEQLEAAFYIQVLSTPYSGMSAAETRLLTDVRDHEIAHRDFFAAALGSAKIPNLTPDFSSINFGNRGSVLLTAQTFEDLGVGAYNGAAKYLKSGAYLLVAGKIVSVEARHASAIRDLREPKTRFFAPAAFDPAFEPGFVLTAADPFIVDTISVINAGGSTNA